MIESVYKNGTYTVNINSHGTKTYQGETFEAEFPDSLDIKITEVCFHNCPFCHESSTKDGIHCDTEKLLSKLKGLPKGVELAIGGGNALLHPNLETLLEKLKGHFNVAITVNWRDVATVSSYKQIVNLIDRKLITSLGISIEGITIKKYKTIKEMFRFLEEKTLVVYHVIPGITYLNLFKEMSEDFSFTTKKFLILGYKQHGRAKDHLLPEDKFEEWRKQTQKFYTTKFGLLGNIIIAFDNLALEQLRIKELIPNEYWENHYMGDEFTHSMYIDACKGTYGPTSRSLDSERSSWDEGTVIDYFKRTRR